MLKKAIEVATRAHAGQVDKAGAPYIQHPLRVMESCTNDKERICAVLHDVIEDTDVTIDTLQEEGFPEDVLQALDCLTKRIGESYDCFIDRILTNKIACYVKLADLKDNMNLDRLETITPDDYKRVEKYHIASDKIKQHLSNID